MNIRVESHARLDRVVQSLTGLSRAGVRGLLDHERVRVNGLVQRAGQSTVNPGDIVDVAHDPHTRLREKPVVKDDPAFELLFEDDHVLVVNKAAHVLTVPTPSGKGNTLIDALQRHVERGPIRGRGRRSSSMLHVVHRLDQGVSGVMVFAKTADAARRIRDQFAAHKPLRLYIAIVNGVMERRKGTIRSHLATDRTLNRYSTRDESKGELAITHFEVLSIAHGATVVRVKLETGRRNQIRVHFAEAGHPVLGDPRYPRARVTSTPRLPRQARSKGRSRAETDARSPDSESPMPTITSLHPKWKARRLALHARSLRFIHPATGADMHFETDLPREFSAFMPPREPRSKTSS